jgi:hypothetical protein
VTDEAEPGRNLYAKLLAHVFAKRWTSEATEVPFEREDLVEAARQLDIAVPKNLGDVLYSFRYRNALPESIRKKAKSGKAWIIKGTGRGKYSFVAVAEKGSTILPNPALSETKVPQATPGLIAAYALSDEQALLAILRYNRLIDVFLGITTYSLQSHLRTAVNRVQIETDEVYVGVDRRGAHFVVPVQAKGGRDKINIVQIEQDMAMCALKFGAAICRPVAAQFMEGDLIALFEFERVADGIGVSAERHYRLVPHNDIEPEDLAAYARRLAK